MLFQHRGINQMWTTDTDQSGGRMNWILLCWYCTVNFLCCLAVRPKNTQFSLTVHIVVLIINGPSIQFQPIDSFRVSCILCNFGVYTQKTLLLILNVMRLCHMSIHDDVYIYNILANWWILCNNFALIQIFWDIMIKLNLNQPFFVLFCLFFW